MHTGFFSYSASVAREEACCAESAGRNSGRTRVGLLNKFQPRHSCINHSLGVNRYHRFPIRISKVFQLFGNSKTMAEDTGLSDLAKIDGVTDHPVELFRIWHGEARSYNPESPDACCLATVSKDSKVSARNVVLREFDNDGFVIVTDKRSRKAQNLDSVPQAAISFLWCYVNDKKQQIARQVRVEGVVKKLQKEEFQHIYDREPLFCKIRSHLCHQDRPVQWEELKERHDEILDEFRRNVNTLPMPDHFIGYKILPTMMEFYYARDHLIGDRILYDRSTLTDSWAHKRLAA